MAAIGYVKIVKGSANTASHRSNPSLRNIEGSKYSIKAAVLKKANCPTVSNNRGLSAPKGKDKKDYEWVVSGAVVAEIPYQEIWGERRALVLI